jgi:hypothetical protein
MTVQNTSRKRDAPLLSKEQEKGASSKETRAANLRANHWKRQSQTQLGGIDRNCQAGSGGSKETVGSRFARFKANYARGAN